jgi:hypothetical protein
VDLKTTAEGGAEPGQFAKSVHQYRYHVQAAFYLDGLAANGVEATDFAFIAVEKSRPNLVGAYWASKTMIDRGRMAYKRDLHTYKRCLDSGQWPGYSAAIEILDLPAWA